MPTRYTGRIVLILFTIWLGFSSIYPRAPFSMFYVMKLPFSPKKTVADTSWRHNLKPGIDIAGGTSLTYEIKQAPGSQPDPELAGKVATVLKERVDPKGVLNLVWRPQGANRLEVQMPLTRDTAAAEKARGEFLKAQRALERFEPRVDAVVSELRNASLESRAAVVVKYAAGNPARTELLKKIATTLDAVKAAEQKQNAADQAAAEIQLDEQKQALASTSTSVSALQAALDLTGDLRDIRVSAIRDSVKDSPEEKKAVDDFIARHDALAKAGDTVEGSAALKRLLQGSGVLSFHILADDLPAGEYEAAVTRLQTEGPRYQAGDVTRWFEVAKPEEFGRAGPTFNGKQYALAFVDPDRAMINREGLPHWALENASADTDQTGRLGVSFRFDPQGSKLFGEMTTRWKPRPDGRKYSLAIVLDDKIISAPGLDEPIFGSGRISSRDGYASAEANYLTSTLNAGSLPAQLDNEPISEVTVGPQLGGENLRAAFIACGLGLVITALFLIGYYYLAGVVAMIAVLINLVLILGSMALLGATFTLPGVAGVVLSVAMAVDANVLIFERLREEQARGLSLRMALGKSYDRAWTAILDGNVTTAISSFFLFWLGSEEVRGFGITLLLGIMTSLFTSLFVTKTIFGLLVDRFGLKDLRSLPRTFPKWNQLLTPNVDWVAKAKIFTGVSFAFIAVGLILLGIKFNQGQALDIEFSGGTSVRVALTEPTDREAVQELVNKVSASRPNDLAAARVVSVGTDDKTYEISTPISDTKAVQGAVIEALGTKLDIARPSRFDAVDADFAAAEKSVIFPVDKAKPNLGGAPNELAGANVGGVAIVLNNLSPALSADQIYERIAQRQLEAPGDKRIDKVQVDTFGNDTGAVIYFTDPRFVYNAAKPESMQGWKDSLAAPAWKLAKDAINNPPQLKSVNSFNPQVAGEARYNTLLALSASVLGIMTYVWVRFGNLKFGAATIVACVHDGLFVLAAIGYSHYLGQLSIFENVLLVKPFRLDLTLVAAVLTVIGYSMNDTVVVFDRIRENRGKFGVLSRRVVNDSINQTMSRTLLTGGTSIGILAVMYVTGGEGIHGFTFAMLLGILCGTYSSVAVAAPLLLFGKTAQSDLPVAPKGALHNVAG